MHYLIPGKLYLGSQARCQTIENDEDMPQQGEGRIWQTTSLSPQHDSLCPSLGNKYVLRMDTTEVMCHYLTGLN